MSLKIKIALSAAFIFTLLSLYVFSILWRVSFAEKHYFGASRLLPISFNNPLYSDPGDDSTFNEASYTFQQNGKPVRVYKQLINSFQHAYGSALAAYELSEPVADLLFRSNEYAEAIFSKAAGTQDWYLDCKKDLHNNEVGRAIGVKARQLGLNGQAAERYMIYQTLIASRDGRVYNHYLDKRTAALPTLDGFGCPYLFQIQNLRSKTPLTP